MWQSGLHTPSYQVQSLEYEKTFHDSDRAASAIVLEQISESSSAQLGDPFRVIRDVATSSPNIVGTKPSCAVSCISTLSFFDGTC